MSQSSYRVLDKFGPRRAADRGVELIAARVRDELVARTPKKSGRLAGGWRLVKGYTPGTWLVVNDVPYARPREFGGRPFMGPVIANWRSRLGR
jgi:hypothetical protein